MMSSCFCMSLYCDNQKADYCEDMKIHSHEEFPHEFIGETRGECYKRARIQGWLIGINRHLCPKCSGKGQ